MEEGCCRSGAAWIFGSRVENDRSDVSKRDVVAAWRDRSEEKYSNHFFFSFPVSSVTFSGYFKYSPRQSANVLICSVISYEFFQIQRDSKKKKSPTPSFEVPNHHLRLNWELHRKLPRFFPNLSHDRLTNFSITFTFCSLRKKKSKSKWIQK
jgi:hypothetical protein